ncbi:MAG: hypothetical protein AB9846_08420 [Tenuifilaceae bacterium]
MKNGSIRFNFYTNQVKELLIKARKEENPALWLFSNNARTSFFMLEALAKLYENLHNAKKFGKLKEQFKMIEDGLGQIDHYNWLTIAFTDKKEIPSEYYEYAKKQLDQKSADLNKILEDKNWLSKDFKRLKKIDKVLDEIDWLKPDKEVEAISSYYTKSIASITEFVSETKFCFDNVEEDVHELRRKMRWLSIYPQALQGVIQFSKDTKVAPSLKKYLTKEIVNSPFNKLPAAGNNNSLLLLNKTYFLALSWMIAKLGDLKDEGLLLTGLCEAIKLHSGCSEREALEKAYNLLGSKQRKMEEILDEAEEITKIFFKEKNLLHLIAKTKTVLK